MFNIGGVTSYKMMHNLSSLITADLDYSLRSVRIMGRERQYALAQIVINHLIFYPTASSLSYLWSLGAATGLILAWQLITGIILVMHYKPSSTAAFISVLHIIMDVNSGWFFRYFHANGASIFFFLLYAHIGRGLYYGGFRFPRELVWMSGILAYILVIAAAFIGYVLPWGQISFWGATVITSMLSSIPGVGMAATLWLWGGFGVSDATLNRFFSLHYLVPFIILAIVIVHLFFLHAYGSGKPLGFSTAKQLINGPFYPYFYVKDLYAILVLSIIFCFIAYFIPNYFGHSDNYLEANPMVTPAHIVPEWYFLPFYAILRSIPNKVGGVVMMAVALIIAIIYPFFYHYFKYQPHVYYPRSLYFLPLSRLFYWIFIGNFLILGFIGGCPVAEPYYTIGQFATGFFYCYWLLAPFIYNYEVFLFSLVLQAKPCNISDDVEPVLSAVHDMTLLTNFITNENLGVSLDPQFELDADDLL